VILLVSVR